MQLVPFDNFIEYFGANWQQGEHISIIGPTGRGKTELALTLCELRRYLIVFATKTNDKTITAFGKRNKLEKQEKFNPNLDDSDKYLVWPSFWKIDDIAKQRQVFSDAMAKIYVQGNWSLYIDEVFYFSTVLRLENYLTMYWSQARSNGISVISATQRPRNVPLLMFDQASHVFLFQVNDEYARKRLAEIGGFSNKELGDKMNSLDRYDFLYLNMVTGVCVRSNVRKQV